MNKSVNDSLTSAKSIVVKARMIEEGNRLKKIARRIWDEIQANPLPTQYIRKEKSNDVNIIEVGEPYLQPNGRYAIEISWKNDLAYHDSVVKNRSIVHPKGHSIWLISEGWYAEELESKIGEVDRFTRYKGTNYLNRVIEEYKKGMPNGYSIEKEIVGQLAKYIAEKNKK